MELTNISLTNPDCKLSAMQFVRAKYSPACRMSHPHCRGNACEVKFVLNTLEFELAQLEAKDGN